MDYLATFENTRSVMQAEQILVRRKIPFETVPHSHYHRKGCGLAILFSDDYIDEFQEALNTIEVKYDLKLKENSIPSEKSN